MINNGLNKKKAIKKKDKPSKIKKFAFKSKIIFELNNKINIMNIII